MRITILTLALTGLIAAAPAGAAPIVTIDGGATASAAVSAVASGNRVTRVAQPDAGPFGVVPEPATWAMMLLGFGALGTLLRRPMPRERRIRFGY